MAADMLESARIWI